MGLSIIASRQIQRMRTIKFISRVPNHALVRQGPIAQRPETYGIIVRILANPHDPGVSWAENRPDEDKHRPFRDSRLSNIPKSCHCLQHRQMRSMASLLTTGIEACPGFSWREAPSNPPHENQHDRTLESYLHVYTRIQCTLTMDSGWACWTAVRISMRPRDR